MAPLDPSAESPFAPPRAGRSAGLWRAWFALRRRFGLGEFQPPAALGWLKDFSRPWAGLGVFFVPTLGLWLLPNRRWPQIGVPLFVLALFFSLTEYARTSGGYAFGLAAAIHGIGAAAFYDRELPVEGVRRRFLRRLGFIAIAALLLGAFAQALISRQIVAVAGKDGPIIMAKSAASAPPRIGEQVAYRLEDRYGGGVRVIGGLYLGRVLASGGDHRVEFSREAYRIGGASFPPLPHMPPGGGFTLDATHAFIWPETFNFITVGQNLPAEIGRVPHSALVGRPLTRWFWHKQTP